MKLTKSRLEQIIKEELSAIQESPMDQDFKAKAEMAKQGIDKRSAEQDIKNGQYGYEHVAAGLRMLALEFDAAAEQTYRLRRLAQRDSGRR